MTDVVLRALTDGDREAFLSALADGEDVNVLSEYRGSARTALHHAAAAGDLATVQLLIEHGGDLDAVDPEYGATPLGWAEFFEQPETAEYLRSL